MRSTIDLPDPLFRRTKAVAAMRGTSIKEIVIQALERELNSETARTKDFPLFHLRSGRKLDLTDFDFDDLLT